MPSKKLMMIGAVVLVLVLGAGGAGFMYMKSMNTDEDTEEAAEPAPKKKAAKKADAKEAPVYVTLDPFIANIKDPYGPRMLQVGLTLVVDNTKTQDMVKQFLPGIRSDILLLLGQYTAEELLTPQGKTKLKKEIGQSIRGAMDLPLEEEDEDEASEEKPRRKGAPRRSVEPSPIQEVLLSSFIVQ